MLCMTISPEARRTDAIALLAALYAALGDAPIDCTAFDPADPKFASFRRTSWDELAAEGLLSDFDSSRHFLTAKGWSEALVRANDHKTMAFELRIGQLSQALKRKVKGRHNSALITLGDVVLDSKLPSGWVFNALDAHLICRIHGKRDAGWLDGARGRVVEIPRDFGLIEIDLFGDVRAENLKLSESLEQVEELYSDFRCDLCGAPLTGRTPWEHEYGWEEASEFACGRTVGAPFGNIPCTMDPKFPKLDDYVLTTNQEGDTWFCFARPANPEAPASLVMLMQTGGSTEQEAMAEMRKRYADRAKCWKG
jgi:hypothetical protein